MGGFPQKAYTRRPRSRFLPVINMTKVRPRNELLDAFKVMTSIKRFFIDPPKLRFNTSRDARRSAFDDARSKLIVSLRQRLTQRFIDAAKWMMLPSTMMSIPNTPNTKIYPTVPGIRYKWPVASLPSVPMMDTTIDSIRSLPSVPMTNTIWPTIPSVPGTSKILTNIYGGDSALQERVRKKIESNRRNR